MEKPIGIFDSGVGGLTVAREIMRQLPNEDLVYFGDTARVPYGSKSPNTILRFSRQIVNFLLTKDVKAIVVACNTASALALPTIQKEIEIPIIGVIEAGAKTACEVTETKHIGVIGTEGTVKSRIYTQCLTKLDPEITVVSKACPLFVPLVEEGLVEDRITDDIASRYLGELKDYDIDTLILGCTHYPLIRNTIARTMGEQVKLVNPAYETTKSLKKLLLEKGMLCNERTKEPVYEYYVSDAVERFIAFADGVLPCNVSEENVKSIDIEAF